MKRLIAFAIVIGLSGLAYGQAPSSSWFTIANEGDTVAQLPAGAVLRYGDGVNNKWSPNFTVTAQTTEISVVNEGVPGGDPDYGTVKVLQVQQQTGTFTVSVTSPNVKDAAAVSIPALPVPTSVTIPYNGTCSTSIAADGTLTISLSAIKAK
jgi:hypothetical protein